MADLAAHLVDRVLAVAPYRQWPLSLPWHVRPRLAGGRRLLTRGPAAFVGAVFRSQRAAARACIDSRNRAPSLARSQPGDRAGRLMS